MYIHTPIYIYIYICMYIYIYIYIVPTYIYMITGRALCFRRRAHAGGSAAVARGVGGRLASRLYYTMIYVLRYYNIQSNDIL